MERIETPRLILRGFTQADYEDVYIFLSQRAEDEFEAYPGITYETTAQRMEYRVGHDDFYAIEEKAGHRVIGNLYFGARAFEARELGFIVNKDFQRKGYAAEAAKALLSHAFAGGLHRVYAECDPRNACSVGLLEHLGFVREALLRQNVYFKKDASGNPIWQDTCVYAMLGLGEGR